MPLCGCAFCGLTFLSHKIIMLSRGGLPAMSAPFPSERNMLLRCVKNYFVSLKHYFAPLGAFALGVILGISVLIPGLISSMRALADSVVQITGSVSFDLGAFVECLADEIGGLDWSDPSAAIGTVFGSGWLADAFNDCIHSLVPGGEAYAAQIEQAVALPWRNGRLWRLYLCLCPRSACCAPFC